MNGLCRMSSGFPNVSDSRANNQGRFVSAQAVAERAGVSRSAVSRAFTPGASIAPATLVRVHEAAAALGYQVNDLARGLLANRSRVVGLVASDADSPFRAQMIAALSQALIKRGNLPAIINIGASRGRRRECQPAAVALPRGSDRLPVRFAEGQPRRAHAQKRSDPDPDKSGGDRPGQRTLRRHGRRAAGIRGPVHDWSLALRRHQQRERQPEPLRPRAGLRQICGRLRLYARVVRAGHSDYDGGQQAAGRLLARGQVPDAIFCVNDLMAFGALDHLRGAGLRVPDDVSVIGFDDVPSAAWSAYRLTTLRQDPERIAREVVSILDRRLADPDSPPLSVYFPVELVIRETVKGRR